MGWEGRNGRGGVLVVMATQILVCPSGTGRKERSVSHIPVGSMSNLNVKQHMRTTSQRTAIS